MWSQIISHNRQIDQLKKALASGRLPNAYVFAGPSGIGKQLVAFSFAQAALCENKTDDQDACGICAACRKFTSNNHPDFFLIEPELSERGATQNIKIDTIRDLQSNLKFSPLEASLKISIIDGADRLMEAAANSLLKILEEPPPATHFILITPYPHRLLPTIRSRCQHMSFSPIPEKALAKEISKRQSISANDALRIAKLSGGSLGTASALEPEFVEDVLGRFLPLTKKASSADIIETAQAWKEMDLSQTKLIFDLLASWYRDILRYQATKKEAELIHPEAASLANGLAASRLFQNLASITVARLAADTAANKQLMFEQLLFSLTN
ncbi:MAG: DNA polymerase III subunit delta' [Pseudomonadota bacterium]